MLIGGFFGLLNGMRHALEPDHLAAVTTLVAGQPSARRAARFATLWGLGHGAVLIAVGGGLYALRQQLPSAWSNGFEAVVACMLIVLGMRAAFVKERPGGAGLPFAVGLVHGLAGSGALTALALATLPTLSDGLVFISLYALGAVIGMAALAGIAGVPLARLARRPRVARAMLAVSGVTSIVFGVCWALPIFATPWERVGEADGVVVYRRFTADSPFVSMKGVAVIDAPMATVTSVLLDDDRLPEWTPDVDARVVRMISPTEYVEYNHVHMPPLISDREFVTNVTLAADLATRTVTIVSEPTTDPLVPPSKRVRGILHASYDMQAIDDTHTRLTIALTTDPKGSLPVWLVNYFQKDWASDVIKGIRRQCAKPNIKPPKDFEAFVERLAPQESRAAK